MCCFELQRVAEVLTASKKKIHLEISLAALATTCEIADICQYLSTDRAYVSRRFYIGSQRTRHTIPHANRAQGEEEAGQSASRGEKRLGEEGDVPRTKGTSVLH